MYRLHQTAYKVLTEDQNNRIILMMHLQNFQYLVQMRRLNIRKNLMRRLNTICQIYCGSIYFEYNLDEMRREYS